MFDEYLYIIKVYDTEETYEYEYGNFPHALEHYNAELSKGNKAELFRCKDGKYERYQAKPKCNCGKCQPKKIQYKPRERN